MRVNTRRGNMRASEAQKRAGKDRVNAKGKASALASPSSLWTAIIQELEAL